MGGNRGGTGPCGWACGSHLPRPRPRATTAASRRQGGCLSREGLSRSCRRVSPLRESPHSGGAGAGLWAGASRQATARGPVLTLEEPGHPAPHAPELRRMEPPKQGGSALRPCLPTSRLAAVRGRDPRQSQTGDGRRTALSEGSSPLSASAGRPPGGVSGSRAGGGFLP